jgi:hypothetical protein
LIFNLTPPTHGKFFDTLGKMAERFKLEIHAHVLMKNQFHSLVHTEEANLSRAIQWLGVSYSVWFNRRHQRSGHVSLYPWKPAEGGDGEEVLGLSVEQLSGLCG